MDVLLASRNRRGLTGQDNANRQIGGSLESSPAPLASMKRQDPRVSAQASIKFPRTSEDGLHSNELENSSELSHST
jgi:hypothetical protein